METNEPEVAENDPVRAFQERLGPKLKDAEAQLISVNEKVKSFIRENPGTCLLGEMPHIFAQLPYPKASLAILEVFTAMAGIELDLTELSEQADSMDEQLGATLLAEQAAIEHEVVLADVRGVAVEVRADELSAALVEPAHVLDLDRS